MKKLYYEIEFELIKFNIKDAIMSVTFSKLDDNELPPDIEVPNPEVNEH